MIYLLLAITVLALDFLYNAVLDEQKKYIWFFACFLTWFLLAFRGYRVGNDTIQYVNAFERIANIPWDKIYINFEKDTGFYYLTKFISSIWDNKTWFLAATAFLSLIGVFAYIRRNTTRPILALFFFITLANYHFLFTGVRQSIAMSVCLLALPFAEKKKFIRFVAIVILAGLCHKSAFIFLLAYVVVRRAITPFNMLINMVVISAISLGYEEVLTYVGDLLGYEYGVEELSNGVFFFAIVLAVLVLAWIYRNQWLDTTKDTVAMNMGVVTGGMWSIRLFSRTIERPAMYWLNCIPIVLTNIIEGVKEKNEYVYILSGSILIALLLFARRSIGMNYSFSF